MAEENLKNNEKILKQKADEFLTKNKKVGDDKDSDGIPQNSVEGKYATKVGKVQGRESLELEKLRKQIDQLNDQFLRAVADKENMKRIMQKSISDATDYSIVNFARDIVNSCDNLERILEGLKEDDSLHEGIMVTWKEFINVLKRYNIERIDPLGQKFDYNFHQAICELVDDTKEPGTVIEVKQSGYTIKDRLLRPAMVVVSKLGEG